MSDKTKQVAIVGLFMVGMALTVFGAHQIHQGFALFVLGVWVVFLAVMQAIAHEESLKRTRRNRSINE